MRLAILNPVRAGGSGGQVKHLAEFIPRVLRSPLVEHVAVVTPEGTLPDLGAAPTVTVSADDYRTRFREMSRVLSEGSFDVALCLIARPVETAGLPVVTMVQNIEPLQNPTYPMPLLWRLRLLALRREHARACRLATRILAVSGHTKNELCRRFRLSPDKVDVVYHGTDVDAGSGRRPDLKIPNEFLFAAGSIVPYRGYEDVIRALARLRDSGGGAPTLVVAGTSTAHAAGYERGLRRLVADLRLNERVIWAGQLSREEMTWCYRNARIFVQSSRAEACPNIQLEAIGSGCLCVSCDQPPMPEISGDAARYYPTGDDAALAQQLRGVLELDAADATALRARAHRRAADFSWDVTARLTIDALGRAVREHSARSPPVR